MSVNAKPQLVCDKFKGLPPQIIFEIVDIVVAYFRELWNFKIDF